jgi:hypothetical protein
MLSPPPTRPPTLRPPAWATTLVHASHKDISALDAAFAAGAALAALDFVVREDAVFAGVWRRRLALKAAAASLEGRAGDETSLRDVLALTRPGGDPGPAGRVYAAWRALAEPRLAEVAAGLGARDPAALEAVITAHVRAAAPAPIAAAAAATAVAAMFPGAAPLALAVADLVLATRLGWRAPVPLLALEAARPGGGAWTADCCAAYARAAARACDLHAELARAAARLEAVASKLRAKGAGAAISALLDDDAVSGAAEIAGMSERGLRRLFDRLVELGAVRELTGRATFRLYGL